MALGTFDGVHLGHQELLRRAVAKRPSGGCSSVLTFDYPPEQVLHNHPRLITDFETRQRLIREAGIDEVVWIVFTPEIAQIRAEEFIVDTLVRALRVSHVVCGFNFRFGYKAAGNPQRLEVMGERYGFSVEIVPPFVFGDDVVSSTRVREAVVAGDVVLARKLLGRFPTYVGVVGHGAARGRKLGFPTANLQISPELVLPGDGVYLTWCYLVDGSYPSLTSISDNPTFNGGTKTVESFLLDFHGDLYGNSLEVSFLEKLRGICRFTNENQLTSQIAQDISVARRQLQSYRLHSGRVVVE